MKYYLVKGKPLGFNSSAKDIASVIDQVLESYHPIITKKSMLSGNTILENPIISFIDGNKLNILATNLVIVSPDEKDFSLKMKTIQSYERNGMIVKFWKIEGYDFYLKNNLSILHKINISEFTNVVEMFLYLMYQGLKGLVSVSFGLQDSETKETIREDVAYNDILEYRGKNIERVQMNP